MIYLTTHIVDQFRHVRRFDTVFTYIIFFFETFVIKQKPYSRKKVSPDLLCPILDSTKPISILIIKSHENKCHIKTNALKVIK